MKKVLYVISVLTLLISVVAIAVDTDQQTQYKEHELNLQQIAATKQEDNRDRLVKCLESADKAWQDALNDAAAKNKAQPQDVYYSYMQATTLVRSAQISECEAQFKL